MARHVAFLSRLFLLWSAFNAIIGIAVAAFAVAAASLVSADRPGIEVAAGVTSATLFVLAMAALVWAAAHKICHRGLDRRRPWARNVALVLAVFNLLLLPLGTALGIYTVWIMLHDEVRQAYA